MIVLSVSKIWTSIYLIIVFRRGHEGSPPQPTTESGLPLEKPALQFHYITLQIVQWRIKDFPGGRGGCLLREWEKLHEHVRNWTEIGGCVPNPPPWIRHCWAICTAISSTSSPQQSTGFLRLTLFRVKTLSDSISLPFVYILSWSNKMVIILNMFNINKFCRESVERRRCFAIDPPLIRWQGPWPYL